MSLELKTVCEILEDPALMHVRRPTQDSDWKISPAILAKYAKLNLLKRAAELILSKVAVVVEKLSAFAAHLNERREKLDEVSAKLSELHHEMTIQQKAKLEQAQQLLRRQNDSAEQTRDDTEVFGPT